ncbi:MAG: redox-sensing transcriptional repressor Rex [Candidatus Sumerlaeaceae bacterium]|jgi:redox-sensing transcriptional repressor
MKKSRKSPETVTASSTARRKPLRQDVRRARIEQIPKKVIKRLSLYLRVLRNMEMNGIPRVSSQALAESLGFTSAQVRKDLAYFGQFGVPGVGYIVSDLLRNLEHILGTDREVRVAIVGAGNLGSALMSYGGFARHGVRIVMAFDTDIHKIGTERGGVWIFSMDSLEERLQAAEIDIVILTVPAEVAQDVAERVVAAGISGILNFVPVHLRVPAHVRVQYVDLAIEIETLSYYLR